MIEREFNFIILMLLLTPLSNYGQNMQNESFSELFDNIILKDTILDVNKSNFIEPQVGTRIYGQVLEYDPAKEYDKQTIRNTICSSLVNENNKISFLKKALEDSNKALFKHSYSIKCECLKEQPIVRQLFSEYYKRRATSGNVYEQYHYLDFVLINELDESYELMLSYLSRRDSLEFRYRRETNFPLYLFNLGYETQSLELLEFFVELQEKGDIRFLSDGDLEEKENVFILLALSDNLENRNRAIELAFRYFNNVGPGGNTFNLSYFLKYIDQSRYKDSLKKWWYYYQELPVAEFTRDDKYKYKYLLASSGAIIADEIGYIYWESIVRNKSLWGSDALSNYESSLIYIAKHVVKGNLSITQKENVISQLIVNNRFLSSESKIRDRRTYLGFLTAIMAAYPDKTFLELKEHSLGKYDNDTWNYWVRELKRIISIANEQSERSSLQKISESFFNAGLIEEFTLDTYDKFLFDIRRLNSSDFLTKTGKIIHFDVEVGIFPVGYKDLFDTEFKEILAKADVGFLNVSEEKEILGKECVYKVSVNNGQNIFKFVYVGGSDWYKPRLFVKAINLALIDKGVKTRLISIETYDQTMQLGVFNPDSYFPIAKELSLYSTAIKYDDGLMIEYE